MLRTLARRAEARERSRLACVVVIFAESVERVFSNEAGEESSFYRKYCQRPRGRHLGVAHFWELTFQGQRDNIVAAALLTPV